MSASVFVVDDDSNVLRYMQRLLELQSCTAKTFAGGSELLEQLQQDSAPDLVFLDVMMPGMDGLQTLERLRRLNPNAKIIMLSCVRDTSKIVQAMKLGALDFLNKPVDGAAVEEVLRRYVRPEPAAAPGTQSDDVDELSSGMFFVAASPEMRKIRNQVGRLARVDVPVLILGESGVGKEVAACLIHKLSPRAHRPLMKVNCAAIPGDLLESELFGYEAGAFTGATHAKPGKFELCNGGTILLDEIGEIPAGLQAKLLQVLQEQRFFRLGGRSTVSVDVRILAATNVNVEEAIRKGKLRLDLYYRLNAFSITIPPLREHREDIPILVQHFNRRLAIQYDRPERTVSRQFLDTCMAHNWPGNIRELHNLMKRYVVLDEHEVWPKELFERKAATSPVYVPPQDGRNLKEMVRELKHNAEAQVIGEVLRQTEGDRRQAAAILQISYKALIYKCQQYGLDVPKRSNTSVRSSEPATQTPSRIAVGHN